MNQEKIAQAQAAFELKHLDEGLALLREVSSNARSPEDIRQAFAVVQTYLGAAAPRGLVSRLEVLRKKPRISVITPTKDRPQMLAHALESLAAQTWADWDCVVVNDGGCSVAEVIACSKERDRLTLIENETSVGQAAARNLAIDRAQGQVLCFLDDDDRYQPGHLEAVAEAMQGTRLGLCYTRVETVLERVDERGRHELGRRTAYTPPRFSHPLLEVRSYMPPVSWGIRTECIQETGAFDEFISFMEDWELLLRLTRQWDMVQIDKVTAEYRLREGHVQDSVSKSGKDTKSTMDRIYGRNPVSDAVIAYARKLYQWLVMTGNFTVASPARRLSN